MNIIAHLSIYWWRKANLPHPSLPRSLTASASSPARSEAFKAMEASGFISPRHETPAEGTGSKTNLYSFGADQGGHALCEGENRRRSKNGPRKDADRVARKKPSWLLIKDSANSHEV